MSSRGRSVSPPALVSRLTIESLAPSGEGIAHIEERGERRTVFVARSAPGDELEVELDRTTRPMRGRLLSVVHASPERVPSPCRHVDRCGGCDFMHLSASAQVEEHRNTVQTLLARSGIRVPTLVSHPPSRTLGYRTRARLALHGNGKTLRLGYRGHRSAQVVDIDECPILDGALAPALSALRGVFAGQRGDGEASIALGVTGPSGEDRPRPVAEIRWTGELGGPVFAGLERLVADAAWAGASLWLPGARAPAVFGDPTVVTTGGDGKPLFAPSAGFAQAEPYMSQELAARAVSLLNPRGLPVVELFAGSGNFTVVLADSGCSTLTAVEEDPQAVAAGRRNLQARGQSARWVTAPAESFAIPPPTRAVLLDPPRTGALGCMQRIVESKVRKVVYVSCDPVTLARDLAVLVSKSFHCVDVEVFEMFPQTHHVEIAAVLERA